MRVMTLCASALLLASADLAPAQDAVSPGDLAPPPEITVPARPEELPPPAIAGQPRVVVQNPTVLRPGMFVTSEVELYPRVRVEDAHEICRGAVPMVIAVMDPHEGPWHPHANRHRWRRHFGSPQAVGTPLVFVQVMVPPTPPRRVKVEHEEIELDYGDYQVNIDAEDGVVEIEYDD